MHHNGTIVVVSAATRVSVSVVDKLVLATAILCYKERDLQLH